MNEPPPHLNFDLCGERFSVRRSLRRGTSTSPVLRLRVLEVVTAFQGDRVERWRQISHFREGTGFDEILSFAEEWCVKRILES